MSFVVHQLEIVVYLKVMLGDPNNKVFVDQERILYLGGNIDVKALSCANNWSLHREP